MVCFLLVLCSPAAMLNNLDTYVFKILKRYVTVFINKYDLHKLVVLLKCNVLTDDELIRSIFSGMLNTVQGISETREWRG
ncbi:hypothetical protein T4A_1270 [Trichinella pseudospiralis]|uniref:Uncharacterized protein n=1 Tax=Trichinella pseudospiralis TaxID=6337 RepID=A0A0V1DZC4_TRIPS|nr:hypothetical protein T4A_1270 [Trichinella pseudospiralis]KRZ35978.1 hypothetical protein T4C_12667 [Trichinella pseudospiralis]